MSAFEQQQPDDYFDEQEEKPAGRGMNLAFIFYVLFRRKWLILGFALAAVMAAGAAYLVYPVVYQSEAKLFVRYVLETKTINPGGSDSEIRSPEGSIINSEIEILTSLDLADEVAEKIGPAKILGKTGIPNERSLAALTIQRNLKVEAPTKSNVIRVVFAHPNREIVRPVLNEIVSYYLKKHVEIHRSIGMFDEFLTQEADQMRSRLAQTEEELRKIKARTGIISLEDTKKIYAEQMSKIRQEMFNAEAELAERKASINERNKLIPEATNESKVSIPVEKITEYQLVCARLQGFLERRQQLLSQFTEENALLKEIQLQIVKTEQSKKGIEKEYPLIQSFGVTVAATSSERLNDAAADASRIAELEAKMKVFASQLEKVRKEAALIEESESQITELQRKKEVEEVQFRHYSSSLERSRIDEALSHGKSSNVKMIQTPSPPFKEPSKRLKLCAGIFAALICSGIALAFFIELYLNRSVRNPLDVETQIGRPLLLSIPTVKGNGKSRRFAMSSRAGRNGAESHPSDGVQVSPLEDQELRPFCEGLRDRVATYFEVRNLTHNPKLIALTSCGRGAGVSTIAAGLAASLSETGEGNVLLVDMNVDGGVAQHFSKGKAPCGLDELLDNGTRDLALVQENLYLVSEGAKGGKLQRILPKRFTSLLPKLKASDYDFIIFDLPPITQTSETARVASFMDMLMLVVESEKTNPDKVRQALAMLGESKTKVSTILNKTQTRVPRWLPQES